MKSELFLCHYWYKYYYFFLIFKENKTYYITDTSLKHNGFSNEIKLQSYSVVIECNEIEQITQSVESTKSLNFRALLDNNPNTFCGNYFHLNN